MSDFAALLPAVGSAVTWTYNVTNPGTEELTNVKVRDDNGTPGNTADDFDVVVNLNLRGTWLVCKYATPPMVASRITPMLRMVAMPPA